MAQPVQVIDQTPDYVQHLRGTIHPRLQLQQRGYIFEQLTTSELEKKKRCERCCRVLAPKDRRQLKGRKKGLDVVKSATDITSGLNNSKAIAPVSDTCNEDAVSSSKPDASLGEPTESRHPNNACATRCKYHPGQVAFKKWTCCEGNTMAPPCRAEKEHVPRPYANGEVEANWRFFKTPASLNANNQTPAVAVAIDCEMGVSDCGESELIRVSVIDYFSGAILLDRLVWPDTKMKHYNTRFSGITRQAMQDARRRRECLFGRKNARKAIWRYVGPETIVIGHAANSDLVSLRWIHPVIIDTLLVEDAILRQEKARAEKAQESEKKAGDDDTNEQAKGQSGSSESPRLGLSLKSLARDRLKREIQVKGHGHDSLEDAVATRDLLHWHITNRVVPA